MSTKKRQRTPTARVEDPNFTMVPQSLLIPVTHISKRVKAVYDDNLPVSSQLHTDIQYALSEFVGFVTQEACDHVLQSGRKTVTSEDVIDSLRMLGFSHYVGALNEYNEEYKQAVEVMKMEEKKKKKSS